MINKKLFFIPLIPLLLISCQKEDPQKSETSMETDSRNANIEMGEKKTKERSLEEFSQENVALFDSRIRTLDEKTYVRELYFVNFSDEKINIKNVYFEGVQYTDEGIGADLIPQDGVFTSIESYYFNDRIPYDKENLLRSVQNAPIVSPHFIQQDRLSELEQQYELRNMILKRVPENNLDQSSAPINNIFEVTCDITFTGGGCNACDWWGGSHCDWCFTLSNCSVTIGF